MPPSAPAVLVATLVATALALPQDGYFAEDVFDDLENLNVDVNVVDTNETCPSDKLIRSRETCLQDGVEVQCIKMRCCDTYRYVAGRCIPKSINPCSLQLCEQKCDVRNESLWCSCYEGFRFEPEHYRAKHQPYCIDVDECATHNGGCEQSCVNDPGGFHCTCTSPYTLAADGKTCERIVPLALSVKPTPLPLVRTKCYASCDTVAYLGRKVKWLMDQLHVTQRILKQLSETYHTLKQDANKTDTGTVLDSMAVLEGNYCRCERGPRGPAGPPGMEGPKGDPGPRGPRGHRGPKGSLDLMLLLLADVRHDIRNLEAKVYGDGERPERFNLEKVWRRQRKLENMVSESQIEQHLEAYTPPAIITPANTPGASPAFSTLTNTPGSRATLTTVTNTPGLRPVHTPANTPESRSTQSIPELMAVEKTTATERLDITVSTNEPETPSTTQDESENIIQIRRTLQFPGPVPVEEATSHDNTMQTGASEYTENDVTSPTQGSFGPVQITPNGKIGEIGPANALESAEAGRSSIKRPALPVNLPLPTELDEKLQQYRKLASMTDKGDDDTVDQDYDYSFY